MHVIYYVPSSKPHYLEQKTVSKRWVVLKIYAYIETDSLCFYDSVMIMILEIPNLIIITIISLLMSLLLGHRPFLWITYNESGLYSTTRIGTTANATGISALRSTEELGIINTRWPLRPLLNFCKPSPLTAVPSRSSNQISTQVIIGRLPWLMWLQHINTDLSKHETLLIIWIVTVTANHVFNSIILASKSHRSFCTLNKELDFIGECFKINIKLYDFLRLTLNISCAIKYYDSCNIL
jgi:hypothetical protein